MVFYFLVISMVLEGLIYWVNSEFIIYYLLEFIKDIVWELLGRFIINIYDGKKKNIFEWY